MDQVEFWGMRTPLFHGGRNLKSAVTINKWPNKILKPWFAILNMRFEITNRVFVILKAGFGYANEVFEYLKV